jgi:glycosyltransferase involved in cell wall biosynthesis
MARYTLGILRATIARPELRVQWRLLHPRPQELPPDLLGYHVSRSTAMGGRPTEAWRAGRIGLLSRQVRADLLWCPTGRGPWGRSAPVVLTVHDLLPLHVRGALALPWREQLSVGITLRRSLASAQAIIAVSRDTALGLAQRQPNLHARLHVVPQAADDIFHEPPTIEAVEELRSLGIADGRLWLHVGQVCRRKNLPRLIRAFAAVRPKLIPSPRLVLVGPDGDASRAVARTIRTLGVQDGVSRIGWLGDDLLRALFERAEIVLCVAKHEGFGRVALEAMTAGRPVLSSGRGALGSLVAQGGWTVDATRTTSLASGLHRLAEDGATRERLGVAGSLGAQGYRWSAAAEQTVTVFHQAHAACDLCAQANIRPQS